MFVTRIDVTLLRMMFNTRWTFNTSESDAGRQLETG